ncbi:MAG: tRNA preQ1(34) S-adenosylmethionine ribosyltransferase-isomerase QueA [Pseudomonadaceae bacterium]|nr:tRNA preQ1(34) S-adenosylmethionine ribosyltransferase-isomerase QueA [Pseudomonadaceae bacterium]
MTPYDYYLPPELIAHTAAEPRESARLLRWPEDEIATYADLPRFLNKGDLLVVNESKVLPARLFGERRGRGEGHPDVKVELLLHRPLDSTMTRWQAMARPMRRLREGDAIVLDGGATARVEARDGEGGFVHVALNLSAAEVEPYLQAHGHTPLPPYIHAEDSAAVRARYQTVYAGTAGSVAAPTAGLHFSESLLEALDKAGIGLAKVTLHVGAGTFLNPTPDQLAAGKLHKEWCAVSEGTAADIQATKQAGRNVVAVGTTTCRTLESWALAGSLSGWQAETDLLICPGFEFRVVDKLITNFHLPGSSLLMLVAAFIGEDALRALYARAIAGRMRFYSFGDGCLLTRASR